MNTILPIVDYASFEGLDIRIGTIIKTAAFEKAKKPAFKMWIDFGAIGIKQSSAQITNLYQLQDLHNKQVVAIVNFKPKQIAGFISECLVLGVYNSSGHVILLQPDKQVENGSVIG